MITIKEVSEKYKVTPRTIYRWIESGAPFKKIGSKWFVESFELLEKWMNR